ncbi:MAG: hypothetical protein FWG90_03510 [Oscillospiraceae bacterium]|nr:hypothetical protein [Oscillospiraceae bacterium]
MVDFNKRKQALRGISDYAEKHKLLLLPCLIAAFFVKAWFALICRLDIAFCDKEGNFFGREERAYEFNARKRQKDDIVYVRKPLFGRLLSMTLAAAFTVGILPGILPDSWGLPKIGVSVAAANPNIDNSDIIQANGFTYFKVIGANRYVRRDEYLLESVPLPTFDSIALMTGGNGTVQVRAASNAPTTAASNVRLVGFTVSYQGNGWRDHTASHAFSTTASGIQSHNFPGLTGGGRYDFNLETTYTVPTYTLTAAYDYTWTHTYAHAGTCDADPQPQLPQATSTQQVTGVILPNEPTPPSLPPATFPVTPPTCTGCTPVVTLSVTNPNPTRTINAGTTTGGATNPVEAANNPLTATSNNISTDNIGFTPATLTVPNITIDYAPHERLPLEATEKSHQVTVSWQDNENIRDTYGNQVPDGYLIRRHRMTPSNPNNRVANSMRYVGAVSRNDMVNGRYSFTDNPPALGYGFHYEYEIEPYSNLFHSEYNINNNALNARTNWAELSINNVSEASLPTVPPLPGAGWLAGPQRGVLGRRATEPHFVSLNARQEGDFIRLDWDLPDYDPTYHNNTNLRFLVYRTDRTTATAAGKWNADPFALANSVAGAAFNALIPQNRGTHNTLAPILNDAQANPPRVTSYQLLNVLSNDEVVRNPDNSFTYIDRNLVTPRFENGNLYRYCVIPVFTSGGNTQHGVPFYADANYSAEVFIPFLQLPATNDGEIILRWENRRMMDFAPNGYYIYIEKVRNGNDGRASEFGPVSNPATTNDFNQGRRFMLNHPIPANTADGAIIEVTIPRDFLSQVGQFKFYNNDTYRVWIQAYRNAKYDKEPYDPWSPDMRYANPATPPPEDGTVALFNLFRNPPNLWDSRDAQRDQNNRIFSPVSQPRDVIVGSNVPAPNDFAVVNREGQNVLTWSGITYPAGAQPHQGYAIYGRVNNGAWTLLTMQNSTTTAHATTHTWTHERLASHDVWEYAVMAYRTVNGVRVFTERSIVRGSANTGIVIKPPTDLKVTAAAGKATLAWQWIRPTAAERDGRGYNGQDVDGFEIEARNIITGRDMQPNFYDAGAATRSYEHTGLRDAETWEYRIRSYKYISGVKYYSEWTTPIRILIGLAAPTNFTATASDRQVALSWAAVTGAEGYVLYLYNDEKREFEPLTILSAVTYSHLGLRNGSQYTYMVAAYRTVNGERITGNYSVPVTSMPNIGGSQAIDHALNIRGVAPPGVSRTELITATASPAAFDEDVDVYITSDLGATESVRRAMRAYGDLTDFIIWSFDIKVYKAGTFEQTSPNPGYNVTIKMPIPDQLIRYRDFISVVHVIENDSEGDALLTGKIEILPSAVFQDEATEVWCIEFISASFSPFALVVWRSHIADISSGEPLGVADAFAGIFGTSALMFTRLPDIMPSNNGMKLTRGKNRYRVLRRKRK